MDYQVDYALDKLLEDGIASDGLIQFLCATSDGLPVTIDVPELAAPPLWPNPGGRPPVGAILTRRIPRHAAYTRPKTGYASMSMVNLSFLGFSPTDHPQPLNSFKALAAPYVPMDGVNEKGLAIGS